MKNKRILCFICFYNEKRSVQNVLDKFTPDLFKNWIDELIVIDDGSDDGSTDIATKYPYRYIRHEKNRGVGATYKTAIDYARKNGYDVIIPVAGNGKMEPSEIPRLLAPMFEEGYDFVQGSRYMKKGRKDNIPLLRYIIQRIGSGFIKLVFKWPGNDVSCGFRAVSMDILNHPEVNVFQDWLEKYGLEPYIQYKAIKHGFKIKQVPASMIYPSEKGVQYTKIPSFSGWWDMFYPWLALKIGLKK